MAVRRSNQHNIGQSQARSGEDSTLRLNTHTYIQLKIGKTVQIGPESTVPLKVAPPLQTRYSVPFRCTQGDGLLQLPRLLLPKGVHGPAIAGAM